MQSAYPRIGKPPTSQTPEDGLGIEITVAHAIESSPYWSLFSALLDRGAEVCRTGDRPLRRRRTRWVSRDALVTHRRLYLRDPPA